MQKLDMTAAATVLLPVSVATPVAFTPDRYKDEAGNYKEGAPVYMVRPPSFRSRASAQYASMSLLLVMPTPAQMNDCAIEASSIVVKPAQQKEVLDVLAAYGALIDDPERMKDNQDGRRAIVEQANSIHQQLIPYSPELRDMMAKRVIILGFMRVNTVRHHIVAVNGAPLPKDASGIPTEDSVAKLPGDDLVDIALFIASVEQPTQDVAKN